MFGKIHHSCPKVLGSASLPNPFGKSKVEKFLVEPFHKVFPQHFVKELSNKVVSAALYLKLWFEV